MRKAHHALFAGVIIVSMLSCKHKTDLSLEEVKRMPDICLNQYGSSSLYDISQQELPGRTVLLFFSPDCEYCEEEIDSICNHSEDYSDVKWLLITDTFYEDLLESFVDSHDIRKLKDVVILMEKGAQYKSLFQITATPSMFIYNSNGKLIHYSRSYVNIDELLDWLG